MISFPHVAALALRCALAASFLSAVADRLGWWGLPGTPGVAWGAWQPFVNYTATLNSFLPAAVIPALAWIATIAEVVLAIALLAGLWLRWASLASAALLLTFAFAMSVSGSVKAPLDYSVFTAAAAALLLAAHLKNPLVSHP
jgi:uncharacterized membrane protein YphA (DoxX/SURF4 family)